MRFHPIKNTIQRGFEWALSVDAPTELDHVERLRTKYPDHSNAALAKKLVRRARWWGIGAGFVTGLPANPWISMPAATADVGAMLRVEVVLAQRIALLYDPTYLDDGAVPYELLVPILGSRAAGEFLKEVAQRSGMGITRVVVKSVLTKATLSQFKRIMLKYFGLKVTQRAVLGKTMPLVGGVIGATWNNRELSAVGKRVVRYFEGEQLET